MPLVRQPAKPILSIDLDNVIRDQIGSIIAATWRRYGVTLNRRQFRIWDPPLGNFIGVSNEAFTQWAWGDPMIFAEAEPMPGVAGALAVLRQYYTITVTTATACPWLTESWLRRWDIPYDCLIHVSDKSCVAFDTHIDDSPATLLKLSQAGRRVFRFALPWNEHLIALPSLRSWRQLCLCLCLCLGALYPDGTTVTPEGVL